MVTFILGVVLLIVGHFTYGKLMEKIFHIEPDRKTPAVAHPDGVDFVPMKTWRIFLIQLLNIAGLGPIYGAIAGACWGPRVYLWIVFGSILGGGIHDYMSGMMSVRQDGASVSEISVKMMGSIVGNIMRVFAFVLLFLIGVNFSLGPAGLLSTLTRGAMSTQIWLAIILVYYFIATFLPIDKIIGPIYPVFGIVLIIMALGVGGATVIRHIQGVAIMPELFDSAAWTVNHPGGLPVWAMMFVTVACGAVSGFHSTQSPIMARCITNEKEGRTVFYGAMIAEGVIALVWASAGVAFYYSNGSLQDAVAGLSGAIAANGQGTVIYTICQTLLGPVGAVLAMLGVIACPITSGDTALRSARLTLADWFKVDQSSLKVRLIFSLPMLVLVFIVGKFLPWGVLWRYFSWSNQSLAAITLWCGAVYLHKHSFPSWASLICVVPAVFMTAVASTYIFQAPEGFKLPLNVAYPIGFAITAVCIILYVWRIVILQKDQTLKAAPVNA